MAIRSSPLGWSSEPRCVILGSISITIWSLIASMWDITKQERQFRIQGPKNNMSKIRLPFRTRGFHQVEVDTQFHKVVSKGGVESAIAWIWLFRSYIGVEGSRMSPQKMKWESEFLFTEPKNELYDHADTHGSKHAEFILEKWEVQSSQDRHWDGVKCPEGRNYSSLYLFQYWSVCFWLTWVPDIYVISNQSL